MGSVPFISAPSPELVMHKCLRKRRILRIRKRFLARPLSLMMAARVKGTMRHLCDCLTARAVVVASSSIINDRRRAQDNGQCTFVLVHLRVTISKRQRQSVS
mmetsp:Transcript_43105/g.135886  ORF Transcript_43105/g.135886 Transcript_43105/m.135886 type:complete len:102 (-) Transcript_43105:190-495(-)